MALSKLDWPQVVLVLGLATLAVLAVVLGPVEMHAPVAGLLVAVAGMLRSPAAAPPAPPPPPSSGSGGDPRESGTRPRRATMPPNSPRVALALVSALFAIALVTLTSGCGGSTMAGIATVAAVTKPVGVGICEAARFTEDVCERHGAYGPSSSGGETAAPVTTPAAGGGGGGDGQEEGQEEGQP